jgi:hypothetical protein
MIQGTFVMIQGTFVMIQGTFVMIQGTFVMIQLVKTAYVTNACAYMRPYGWRGVLERLQD